MTAATAQRVDVARGSWESRASCRGLTGDLFFSGKARDRQIAERVCQSCPVRRECADFGEQLGSYYLYGMWGGVWHNGNPAARW